MAAHTRPRPTLKPGLHASDQPHRPATTKELRALMVELLPTDEDLEGFLIDSELVAIKRNFSNGMTRKQKENLILEKVEPETLSQLLLKASDTSQHSAKCHSSDINAAQSLMPMLGRIYKSLSAMLGEDVRRECIEGALTEWKRVFPRRHQFEKIQAGLKVKYAHGKRRLAQGLASFRKQESLLRQSDRELVEEFLSQAGAILESYESEIVEAITLKNFSLAPFREHLVETEWPSLEKDVSKLGKIFRQFKNALG